MKPIAPPPDPTKARTPYRRQVFHQEPQPSKNVLRTLRNQSKGQTQGKATELRIGHRLANGETVWFMTESEYAKYRMEVLANKQQEQAERKARMQSGYKQPDVDTWAKHT